MKPLNQLRDEVHANARDKGWHDPSPSFGEAMALIRSEVSEALEDYRSGYLDPNEMKYESPTGLRREKPIGRCRKPAGIPSELADIIIRVLDVCGTYDIDIERAFDEKMEFNKTRGRRHGGKKM